MTHTVCRILYELYIIIHIFTVINVRASIVMVILMRFVKVNKSRLVAGDLNSLQSNKTRVQSTVQSLQFICVQ